MRRIIPQVFFSAADAGGGGGDGGEGAGGAASDNSGGAAAAAAGGQPAPSAGSPAAGGEPAPAAGQFYRPEGLADHMIGKDQNETMDNMATALKGYRERDGEVPDKAEAYGEFKGEIPEAIKGHLETLTADPLFGRVAAKALEMKMPVSQYQALAQEFMSVSVEMGLMEPIVNVEAERAELVPDNAKHLPANEQKAAVERRMNDNFAYLDAMVARVPAGQPGALAKDDAEFAKAMLGDSAKGHRVFEWMRTQLGGAGGTGPAMQPGVGTGADPKKELAARAALPQNTWGHKEFDRASYDALQADYKRLHGE